MTGAGAIYVGVDGGGTHATALATDAAGRPLARVEGGAALVRNAEPAAGAAALAALVRRTLREAGGAAPAQALCCALAGAGRETAREALRRALEADGCARRVRVTGDAEAALQDAFGDGPGLLVISGTGSIAFGRAADGRIARVGGWGERLGDEGSGYALGLAALRASARAHDGRGSATALLDACLRHTGAWEPSDLIGWVERRGKREIAALAPSVLSAAAAGDAVAAAIVATAADDLAAHVAALRHRLGMTSDADATVALAGGLLMPGTLLRIRLLAALDRIGPDLSVLPVEVDGARGAAALARLAAADESDADGAARRTGP